jgi:non-ribosomal peptide synthetase-like protein
MAQLDMTDRTLAALALGLGTTSMMKGWGVELSAGLGYGLCEPIATHVARAVTLEEAEKIGISMWLGTKTAADMCYLRIFDEESAVIEKIVQFLKESEDWNEALLLGSYTEESRPVGLFDLLEEDAENDLTRKSHVQKVRSKSSKIESRGNLPSVELSLNVLIEGFGTRCFSEKEAIMQLEDKFHLTSEICQELFSQVKGILGHVDGNFVLQIKEEKRRFVSIALAAGRKNTIVRGTRESVVDFAAFLEGSCKRQFLNIVSEILSGKVVDGTKLEEDLRQVSFQRMEFPVISPTSGKPLDSLTPKHWAMQLKQRQTAIVTHSLRNSGISALVCVGHDTLILPSVLRQVQSKELLIIRCWSSRSDFRSPLAAAGACWALGQRVDMEKIVPHLEPSIRCPTQVFNRNTFWNIGENRLVDAKRCFSYEVAWKERKVEHVANFPESGSWLLIGCCPLLDEAEIELKKRGQIAFKAGPSFFFSWNEKKMEYFFRPEKVEDLERIFSAWISKGHVSGVISFVGVSSTTKSEKDTMDFFAHFHAHLFQAARNFSLACPFMIVTSGAYEGTTMGSTSQSFLRSMALSARLETGLNILTMDVMETDVSKLLSATLKNENYLAIKKNTLSSIRLIERGEKIVKNFEGSILLFHNSSSFGFLIAGELIRLGCKKIIVAGKEMKLSWQEDLEVEAKSFDCVVSFVILDTSSHFEISKLTQFLDISGIIFADFEHEIRSFELLDVPEMRKLHQMQIVESSFGLMRLQCLEFIAVCVSATCVIPFEGMTAKAADSVSCLHKVRDWCERGILASCFAIGLLQSQRSTSKIMNSMNDNLAAEIFCQSLQKNFPCDRTCTIIADLKRDEICAEFPNLVEAVSTGSRGPVSPSMMGKSLAAVPNLSKREGYCDVICGIVSVLTEIPVSELTEKTCFADIGLDSLSLSSLRDQLSQFTMEPLKMIDVMAQETLGDLAFLIEDNAREGSTNLNSAPAGARQKVFLQEPDLIENEDDLPLLARHTWIRSIVQIALMFLMVGYVGIAFFPSYIFFNYIFSVHFVLIPVTFVVFNLSFMLLAISTKWIVIGTYKPGRHKMWSTYFLCWWFLDRLLKWMQFWVGSENYKGSMMANLFYLAMGANVQLNSCIDEPMFEFDLIIMKPDCGTEASLSAAKLEDGELVLGPICVMENSWVGMQAVIEPCSLVPRASKLDDMSVFERGSNFDQTKKSSSQLFSGSPARLRMEGFVSCFGGSNFLFVVKGLLEWAVTTFIRSGALVVPLAPAFLLFSVIQTGLGQWYAIGCIPILALCSMISIAILVVLLKWILLGRITAGTYSRFGWFAFRRQVLRHVYLFLDSMLFMHNTTKWLQFFFRVMGVQIGSDCLVGQPTKLQDFDLIEFKGGAFVAAMTFFRTFHVVGDKLVLSKVCVGGSAWIGTGSMLQPESSVPDGGAVSGLSLVKKGKFSESASMKGIPCKAMGTVPKISARIGYFTFWQELAQVILSLMSFALFGLALISGYVLMDFVYNSFSFQPSIFHRSFVFSFSFVLAFIVVTGCLCVEAVVVRNVLTPLIGSTRPIKFVHGMFWLSNVSEGFMWATFGLIGGGSELMNWILRRLGAQVGERAFVEPLLLADPPMLQIGRASTIRLAMVEAHAPPHGKWLMEFGSVRIGSYSSVERNCLVIYPLDMGSRSKFVPLTRPLIGEKILSGSVLGGITGV